MRIDEPIIITGAARSGTSLTAGIISNSGAWGGKLSGPTRYNKKGMFENTVIRNEVVKPFLRSRGYDPLGQKPLPRMPEIIELAAKNGVAASWRLKILDIIRSQGYSNDVIWFYKGAKACLLWPIWNRAFPLAKWIIVRRDTEDIVKSCLRTSFMRAYSKRSGWLRWIAEHERRFEEMIEAQLNVVEVWPQRMIAGDYTEIQNVVNKMGLTYSEQVVREFVDPALWKTWQSRKGELVNGSQSIK